MTGILTISPDQYHADQVADQPTLSASIAHTIISKSSLHAWTDHPKLNPNFERKDDGKFDLGNAVHSLLLEGIDKAHVIVGYDDWRKKDAQQARDEARAHGRIPMLQKEWDKAQAMVEAAQEHLGGVNADPPLFTDGQPEITLAWSDDGVGFRSRVDWLRYDYAVIEDIKTTSRVGGAEHGAFSKALYGLGYDMRAAFYIRAVRAVTGITPTFRWTVIETAPPYALSVVTPGPDVLAVGDSKVDRAVALWKSCLESGKWPGYPPFVWRAELPPYEEVKWLEKEAREAA